MSSFPNPEFFSTAVSKAHLNNKNYSSIFVIKKAKGVYLYDLDQHKYIDFSFNQGLIFEQHSPPSLSKHFKNALSYGFNTNKLAHKFMHKIISSWKKITDFPQIQLYTSICEMILAVLSTHYKKATLIGVENKLLLDQLSPLQSLIKVKILNPKEPCDLYCYENANHEISSPSIQFHHRFLFRQKKTIFHKDSLHFIFSSPFGGQNLGVLASEYKIPFTIPDFGNGILLLEGAKEFSKLSKLTCPKFIHEHFDIFEGYAISKKDLDPKFFLERGIYLENNTLYFSPKHSEHDLRRLHKVLKEYFSQYQ